MNSAIFKIRKEEPMKQSLTLRRLTTAIVLMAGFGGASAYGQFAASGTTTLSCTVATEASISITTTTTTLSSTPGLFVDYTGTTAFTYKIRTTEATGTGAVNVKITSNITRLNASHVATPSAACY